MRHARIQLLDDGSIHHATCEDAPPLTSEEAATLPPPGSYALWDRGPIEGGGPTGRVVEAARARVLAPCLPSKILGVGLNYRAHAREMGKTLPDEPLLFMKPPSAIVANLADVARPRGYARVDFEGELAVVIGRRARHVRERDAADYILGYTICNDITVRDLQKKDVQYTRAKGFDGFCPLGPYITPMPLGRAQDLALRTTLRGEVRQSSSTADMVFPIAALVAFVSRVMTLEPGDVISTGTPPGVGDLRPGDEVAITIDGIGTLVTRVVDTDDPDARDRATE